MGSDIIYIDRIRKILLKKQSQFIKKIMTCNEIALLYKVPEVKFAGYVAKRFAAKEAFSKALGTGIGQVMSFCDVEVLSDSRNKPFFKLSEKLHNWVSMKYGKDFATHLTMSDEKDYALAFAIIEKK